MSSLRAPPLCAVQVATWLKKTFALKPAINRARKARGDLRAEHNPQVDAMY